MGIEISSGDGARCVMSLRSSKFLFIRKVIVELYSMRACNCLEMTFLQTFSTEVHVDVYVNVVLIPLTTDQDYVTRV